MLFSRTVVPMGLSVLRSSSSILATPIPANAPASSPVELSASKFKRENIEKVLSVQGNHQMKAVFNGNDGTTARKVCNLIVHGNNCDVILWMVLEMFQLLLAYNNPMKTPGTISNGINGDSKSKRGTAALQHVLAGFKYTSIEDVTAQVHAAATTTTNLPTAVTNIYGLSISSNNAMNLQHYDYGNGAGHFYLPTSANIPGASAEAAFSNIVKRDKPNSGWKLSYRNFAPSNMNGQPQTQMPVDTETGWLYAIRDHDIGNWIGMLETTDRLRNAYWRLIPEVRGFGLDYEDVNVCGNLDDYL